MESPEFYWFVGLFEGEGSFTISHNVPKGLAISMTDLDILERVQRIVGGSVIPLSRREAHHKDVWLWRVSAIEAIPVVERMIPLLGERRKQRAEDFIALRNLVIARLVEKKEFFSARRIKIWTMYQKGLKHREIAAQLNMDRGTVTSIINQVKLESSHSPA